MATKVAPAVGGCANAQTVLSSTLSSVTCTGTTSCTCPFTDDDTIDSTATSSISGSTLTTDPGTSSQETYSFCRGSGSLTYRHTGDTATYTMQP